MRLLVINRDFRGGPLKQDRILTVLRVAETEHLQLQFYTAVIPRGVGGGQFLHGLSTGNTGEVLIQPILHRIIGGARSVSAAFGCVAFGSAAFGGVAANGPAGARHQVPI